MLIVTGSLLSRILCTHGCTLLLLRRASRRAPGWTRRWATWPSSCARCPPRFTSVATATSTRVRNDDDEWSCREAAGGIPESAREPSLIYPAGRVCTPADPSIPPGRESSGYDPRGEQEMQGRHTTYRLSKAAAQRDRRQRVQGRGHTGAQSRSSASGGPCQRLGVGYGSGRSVLQSIVMYW